MVCHNCYNDHDRTNAANIHGARASGELRDVMHEHRDGNVVMRCVCVTPSPREARTNLECLAQPSIYR